MSSKRYGGREADKLEGGEYEAAVNQEKEDDRRSHRELVGGTLPQQMGSGGNQEEVSVAALNVRTRHGGMKEQGSRDFQLFTHRNDLNLHRANMDNCQF